jgi:hypothetical protein
MMDFLWKNYGQKLWKYGNNYGISMEITMVMEISMENN